jgi:hypothetical protein
VAFAPERLPRSFTATKPQKIRATFRRFEKGVLGTKLYALLYSALRSRPALLEDVGRAPIDFVAVCAAVADRRKHGSGPAPNPKEAEELARLVSDAAKAMLPIFRTHGITSTT